MRGKHCLLHSRDRHLTLGDIIQDHCEILTEQQEDPPEPVLTVKVASEVIGELNKEGEKSLSELFHGQIHKVISTGGNIFKRLIRFY